MKTLLACLLLAGCASLPYASMTAEQIEALAKVKDATLTCVSGVYAGATVRAIYLNIDKGIPAGVTVTEDCKLTFDAKPAVK